MVRVTVKHREAGAVSLIIDVRNNFVMYETPSLSFFS